MCLDMLIQDRPTRKSLLQEVEGWAVRKGSKSLFPHPSLAKGRPRGKPSWGVAHINPVWTSYTFVSPNCYPSGFHIFTKRTHAEEYLAQLNSHPSVPKIAAEVVPVLGRGVLATGTQYRDNTLPYFWPIVVVLEVEPR